MGRLFAPPDEEPAGREIADAAALPLPARMRPRTLEEFAGQSHLLGPASALRTAIQSGEPHSMILYGPPGTGKTTLARMLAEYADAAFEELSAVEAGRAAARQGPPRPRQGRPADPPTRPRAPPPRPPHDLLPGRDPSLQQGPAGRAAAGGGGGPGRAGGGDDREPVLRGQLGAALADSDLRAAGAHGRGRRGAGAAGARGRGRLPRRGRRRVP